MKHLFVVSGSCHGDRSPCLQEAIGAEELTRAKSTKSSAFPGELAWKRCSERRKGGCGERRETHNQRDVSATRNPSKFTPICALQMASCARTGYTKGGRKHSPLIDQADEMNPFPHTGEGEGNTTSAMKSASPKGIRWPPQTKVLMEERQWVLSTDTTQLGINISGRALGRPFLASGLALWQATPFCSQVLSGNN